MEDVVDRFGWMVHSYCLMTNHYHLMIETPKGNLIQGMRQLNGVYTRRFNSFHGRVGHLFQGRYKSILVEKESHLLSLCRYIVNNPVAAGMVRDASEWNWSSYQATAGLASKLKLLTTDWVLEQFGGSADRYRQYIVQADMAESPLFEVGKSNVLGSAQFRAVVQQ
ncbi:MAG: transposase [Mariprofundaceae bacterium]